MGKDLTGKQLGKGYSQRPDGRYEARATINGTKIDMYNMNLSQLKKDFELEKAKILSNANESKSNITIEQWYDEWFIKCKSPLLKSETSRNSYNRKCKNTFISILGNIIISNLTQINIQEAANSLIEHYSERTVREAIGVLRECLDIAVVNNIIRTNPCVNISIKHSNTMIERRVLTHEEQTLFLNEVKGSYYEEVYKFLLSTGVRIGELSGLQWGDIDWSNKCVHIRRSMQTAYFNGKKVEELTTPKTSNSYRDIPFFNETESILKSWKKKQDIYRAKMGNRWRCNPEHGDLVFTSTVGSPVTRYVIVHDIKRIENNLKLKEINSAISQGRQPHYIEHIHPHAFRHTFATRCFEMELNPLYVQSIMGHANYSTTLSYTHLLNNVKERELAKAKVKDFLA